MILFAALLLVAAVSDGWCVLWGAEAASQVSGSVAESGFPAAFATWS